MIADKLDNIKCQTHARAAKIEIVRGNIQITGCCDKHKRFLERQVEYEIDNLFNKEEEETAEVLSLLRWAV